jgi:hypothetical protein
MRTDKKKKENIYEEKYRKLIRLIHIDQMLKNATIVPPKK